VCEGLTPDMSRVLNTELLLSVSLLQDGRDSGQTAGGAESCFIVCIYIAFTFRAFGRSDFAFAFVEKEEENNNIVIRFHAFVLFKTSENTLRENPHFFNSAEVHTIKALKSNSNKREIYLFVFGGWLNWPQLAQLESGVGGASASPGPVRVWGGGANLWCIGYSVHRRWIIHYSWTLIK